MTAQLFANLTVTTRTRGCTHMLIYENLARARQLDAERSARQRRLVRGLSTARRWDRISRWAARRADRATATL